MDFLSYSYLQSGQEAKAREVIEHTHHLVGASEQDKAEHHAYLAARTALELHRWQEAASLSAPGVRSESEDTTEWARAIGAARSGNRAAAEAAVKELTESVKERESRARRSGYNVSTEKATDLREAEAWLAFAEGQTDQALEALRAAAERQDKEGSDSVVIPAREMLGDMLMELERGPEALAEYKLALRNAPKRFDALLGAGRAAQASGDTSSAQAFYAKLTQMCPAGADRPELAEARTVLAQK
jgi:tetratricopeptide (TPR) repeat protein